MNTFSLNRFKSLASNRKLSGMNEYLRCCLPLAEI
jgi:hypothetical protein